MFLTHRDEVLDDGGHVSSRSHVSVGFKISCVAACIENYGSQGACSSLTQLGCICLGAGVHEFSDNIFV